MRMVIGIRIGAQLGLFIKISKFEKLYLIFNKQEHKKQRHRLVAKNCKSSLYKSHSSQSSCHRKAVHNKSLLLASIWFAGKCISVAKLEAETEDAKVDMWDKVPKFVYILHIVRFVTKTLMDS